MKRFCLLSVFVTASFIAGAQNQVSIFAGPQATAARYTIQKQLQKNETVKYGFHIGTSMKVPFEGNIYFAPAVFYSLKGYHVNFIQFVFPPDADAINNNTTLHTFELAPMLQVDLGSNPNHFFIKAGPSLDFQLSGKESFELETGEQVDRSMKFSYGDYGRVAANLIGQFGFETGGGFLVYTQYSHGVGSINNADEGPRIRHRVYGLTIGKYFKNKKIVIDTRNRQ